MGMTYFDKFNSMNFDTKIRCQYMDENNNEVIISIDGDMETFYTKFFTRAVLNLFTVEEEVDTIYLDLNKVNYVYSSFIAALLQIIHKANQADISLYFINLTPHAKDVVYSVGLGHFVKPLKKLKKVLKIKCNNCEKNVTIKDVGEFECPNCRALLYVSDKGVAHD